VGDDAHKLLPKEFLEMPEVGTLTGEGGAMNLPQGREPLCVMTPEVVKDSLVGVEPYELADDFDGEDLGIGEPRGGAALSEGSVFEPLVDEAEDGYDEGAKIHKKTSYVSGVIGSTLRVRRSSLLLKSSKKLAHGVS
jgi:hypothetical protein